MSCFFASEHGRQNAPDPDCRWAQLAPAHMLITELLRKHAENAIIRVPCLRVVRTIDSELIAIRRSIAEHGIWGVRLMIRSPSEREKWRTKKANVWCRMMAKAAGASEIAYKCESESDESLFQLAHDPQLPLFEQIEAQLLLCGIGANAEVAIREAVNAENEFDPREWDLDGYFCARPSMLTDQPG